MTTKRLLFSVLIVFNSWYCKAQHFVLTDGEYMDTVMNLPAGCHLYNAYYYQVGGKYPENSYSIVKRVQKYLQVKNNVYAGSGHITFRFTIDCSGKMVQKIQVLQTDQRYISCHFNGQLVDELFLFLKTMDKWRTAKTKEDIAFSYQAFITFKIENGKVINIIP